MPLGHPVGQRFAHAAPLPQGVGEGPGAAHLASDEEPEVLKRMRTIDLLDGMRTLAKERRRARFTGGIAFAVNSLCIRTCDCLSACLQGMGEAELVHRHGETLQIMDILLELCASPQVLARWRYSAEQIAWFVERIGPAVGAGRAPDAKAC